MDKNSFMQGYLLGCRLRGQRPEGKKPTAYLFNDVRLPALPEWDKSVYPYAVMVYNGTQYRLVLKGTPFTVTVNSGYVSINPMNYPKYRLVDGAWESFTQFTASWTGVMWANHDLYYADSVADVGGTLYLAASDPIPVYE